MPKVYFKSRNHGTGVQAWREANGLAKATTLVLFSRILQMLLGQIPYHRIILKEVLPGWVEVLTQDSNQLVNKKCVGSVTVNS